MELKIYNPQDDGFVQKIEWNYEDLKTEVAEAADSYALSVYTDDAIKQAKADRAKLNKFVDALKGKRTEIRKKLLEPDERFGQEVQEIIGIVQKAIDNIDSQVKDYERRQREEKTAKVRDFYDCSIHEDIIKYLPFERAMKPEYANASTSMKSVKEEMLALIQKVDEGLDILNQVDSPYAGEMKEVFLQTYDIGAAMAERNRLEAAEQKRQLYVAEQERKKAEREAQMQEQAERVMSAGRSAAPLTTQEPPSPVPQPKAGTVEDPVSVIDFRVHVTRSQAAALKDFLNSSGIRFEPVPKQ